MIGEAFRKNNKYSDAQINQFIKNCHSWSDEQIWYLYDGNQDKIVDDIDRNNQIENLLRIHPHIRDRAVKVILKRVKIIPQHVKKD